MARFVLTLACLAGMNMSMPAQAMDFDSLWNYSDPHATEQKFRDLLPAAESSGIPGYHAELLTQIARTLGLQGQFDSAHQMLDSVEPMLDGLGPRPRVRYLLERGRTFNSSGHPDSARPLFSQAWELAIESALDFHAVDAAHMLAIVAPTEHQMEWNLKAVEVAKASNDPLARRWLGSLWNNMGWTYFDQQQYDSALAMFESALDFRVTQKKPEEIRIARWCVAKTKRYLGRTEEALNIQRALAAELDSSGAEQDGFVFEELAECLWLLGEKTEAQDYFDRAYTTLSRDPWFVANEAERLERLRRMAAGE
jgi:hypothetical protein